MEGSPPRANRRGYGEAFRRFRFKREGIQWPRLVYPAKAERVLKSIPEDDDTRLELWQRILLEQPLPSWTDSPISNQPLSYWVGCYRRWVAARFRPTLNSVQIKEILLVSAATATKLVSLFRRRSDGDSHEIWFFALITAGVLLSPSVLVPQKIRFVFEIFDFQDVGQLALDEFCMLWKAVHVGLGPIFGVDSKVAPPTPDLTAYATAVFSAVNTSDQRTAFTWSVPAKRRAKQSGVDWRGFASWMLEVETEASLPWSLLMQRYSTDSKSSLASSFRAFDRDDPSLSTRLAPAGPHQSEVRDSDPAPSQQKSLPSKTEVRTMWKIWRSLREAHFSCIPDFLSFRQFLDTPYESSNSGDLNREGWHPNQSMELRIFEVVRQTSANLLKEGRIDILGDFGSFCAHVCPSVQHRHLRIFRLWIEKMEMEEAESPSNGEICAVAANLLAEELRPLVPPEERARLEQIFQDCDTEQSGFITLQELMAGGFCDADYVAIATKQQGLSSEEGLELHDFLACFCYPHYKVSEGAARRQVMSLFQEHVDRAAGAGTGRPSLTLPDVPLERLHEWSALFLTLADRSGGKVNLQHLLHASDRMDCRACPLWRGWAQLEPEAMVSFSAYVFIMCMARRYKPPFDVLAKGAEDVLAATPRTMELPPVTKPAHLTYARGCRQRKVPNGFARLRYERLQSLEHTA